MHATPSWIEEVERLISSATEVIYRFVQASARNFCALWISPLLPRTSPKPASTYERRGIRRGPRQRCQTVMAFGGGASTGRTDCPGCSAHGLKICRTSPPPFARGTSVFGTRWPQRHRCGRSPRPSRRTLEQPCMGPAQPGGTAQLEACRKPKQEQGDRLLLETRLS